MPKIDVIWAFISFEKDDPEDEGIIGCKLGESWMPFVASDQKRIDSLRPFAEGIAYHTGKRIVLAKFKNREDVEVIK